MRISEQTLVDGFRDFVISEGLVHPIALGTLSRLFTRSSLQESLITLDAF